MESDVIGLSLKGVLPKDDDDKEEEKDDNSIIDNENPLSKTELENITEQVIDAMCEDKSQVQNGEEKSDAGDNKEVEESAEKKDEEENNKKEDKEDEQDKEDDEEEQEDEEGEEEEAMGDEASEKEGEDEEEISNLQLAWEVLEVSKNIYSKSETDSDKLMVANCLMKLAEVSREKDEFDPAIVDFKSALEMRQSLCEAHDRKIAEVQFELAITYFTKGDLNEATSSFKECTRVLTDHVSHLDSKLATVSDEEKQKLKEEIEQVNEIIKDVNQRSEDAAEEIKSGNNKPVIKQDKPSFTSNSDGPASDINHLVKKKRTVDDEAKENDETALKKQKTENGKSEEMNGGDCKKMDSSIDSSNPVPVNGQ